VNSEVEARERTEDHERGRDADSPTEIPAKGWKDIGLRVKESVKEDHTVLNAAGVAFFAFLSLIPALAALVSIAGLVWEPDTVADRVEDLLGGLPAEARELLSSQLQTLADRTDRALSFSLAVSIVLSLWAASSGMAHLVAAVNLAYDEPDRRSWFARRGLALALTLAAMVFIGVAVVGLAALPTILDGLGLPPLLQTVINILFWPVLAAGFAVGLAVLYRFAPNRDSPRWTWVSWGSAVAVVAWVAVAFGFRVYAENFGTYDETYGSLSAVIVLMMFIFITALVVLLGAEVNSEIEHQTARDTTTGPEEPMGDRGAVVADNVGPARR
jgi:membrane protein